MDIVEATQSYETWLGKAVPLVPEDLKAKHDVMRKSAFGFLRATYYRWTQQLPALCPEAAEAPAVLGIGDLHVENFGTWRDGEARLVWGVNDFDEATTLPYAADLIRLATSVLIAIDEGSLSIGARHACNEILDGYTKAMAAPEARPFVLEEGNRSLREIAMGDRHSPRKFWKRLQKADDAEPPPEAKALLLKHLPKGAPEIAFKRRTAGAGSLGLPRFVALRELDLSLVAREAKARGPSVRGWTDGTRDARGNYAEIVGRAIRPHDPFLIVETNWIVRRLAPHCERIALSDIDDAAGRRDVLNAMGAETANIHRGTRGAAVRIRKHLAKQEDDWLHDAARLMAGAVQRDRAAWRKRG